MARSLEPQPASGEVLGMMEEHIDQQDHHRNIKVPYGSIDSATTVAGSTLKGCIPRPTQTLSLFNLHVYPLQRSPVSTTVSEKTRLFN